MCLYNQKNEFRFYTEEQFHGDWHCGRLASKSGRIAQQPHTDTDDLPLQLWRQLCCQDPDSYDEWAAGAQQQGHYAADRGTIDNDAEKPNNWGKSTIDRTAAERA